MRLIAVRKSVTGRPLRLSDAELEIRSSRAAKAGSEPTTLTICSMVDFGFDRMRRTRTAISGNEGKSTLPRGQFTSQRANEFKSDIGGRLQSDARHCALSVFNGKALVSHCGCFQTPKSAGARQT